MVTGPQSPKYHGKILGANPGRANSNPCIFTLTCESKFPEDHRGTFILFYVGSLPSAAVILAGSENTVLARGVYISPEPGQRKIVSVIFIPAK